MGEFSFTHILLLAVIVLIFFGPSRLPQLGQSLGKAIRGFKQGISEIDAEVKNVNDTSAPQQLKGSQTSESQQHAESAHKEKETHKS